MAKVVKISKPKNEAGKDEKIESLPEMTAVEAMSRLAEVMNNTPKRIKLKGSEYEITALKPGTQWLIAEESVMIQKAESANFSDVIKQFAVNVPSVVKILTLAVLNDRDRIFSDYRKREYSEEFDSTYEDILWNTDQKDWINVLVEVMKMISLDFFFDSTNAIAMLREMALGIKRTKEELKSSSAAPSGGR